MQKITYSGDIADMIRKFLIRTHCRFSFDDQWGRFRFSVYLSGRISKVDYTVNIRKKQYTVYAVPSVYFNPNNKKVMTNMAELICRVNNNLTDGALELDMQEGKIRYKYFVDCSDNTLTAETVEKSICVPGTMLKQYEDNIANIISGHAAVEEAFDRCIKPPAKEPCMQISRRANDDSEEYDRMMDRLRERLKIPEDEVLREADWDIEIPKHIKLDLFGAKGGSIS